MYFIPQVQKYVVAAGTKSQSLNVNKWENKKDLATTIVLIQKKNIKLKTAINNKGEICKLK